MTSHEPMLFRGLFCDRSSLEPEEETPWNADWRMCDMNRKMVPVQLGDPNIKMFKMSSW